MKKILTLTMALLFAMSVIAVAGDEMKKETKPMKEMGKEVTLTGEILDMNCYMEHSAMGADHAKCAQSCIAKGLPAGFLAADGTVYLLIGKDHEPVNAMVADWAGKKSTITGTVMENNGLKAIELKTIGAVKS